MRSGSLLFKNSYLNTDLGIRSGSWEPTVEHGTITGYYTNYYKIGKLVNVSCAIWGSGDGTDNIVTVSLPFVVRNIRAYGCVGYFPASSNYPNLHVVSSENLDTLVFEYGTTTNVTSIKGKEWGTCQFSMTYITD